MGSVLNLKENRTVFIPCGCRSEILVVEYDNNLELADFAIYENRSSYIQKMSFWHRLRYIWQILWHKKPYADQITLSKKQLKELEGFLHDVNSD